MEDNVEQGQGAQQKITRRDFLLRSRDLAAGVTAGAISGAVGKEIIDAVVEDQPRIETDSGVFLPYYERHDVRIDVDKISSETDSFFLEYIYWKRGDAEKINAIYEDPPEVLASEVEITHPDLANRLKEIDAKLLMLDIKDFDFGMENMSSLVDQNADLGKALMAVGVISELSPRIIDKISKIRNPRQDASTMDRRGFLKFGAKVSVAIGAWLASPSLGSEMINDRDPSSSPVERVLTRAYGIQSNLHPEHAKIFLRNLVWAHKLLDLSEKDDSIKKELAEIGSSTKNNEKPIFGMEIGALHGGVEDMLALGKKGCETLLTTLYSKEALIEIGRQNQSVDNISKTKMVDMKLKKGITIIDEDLDTAIKVKIGS